MRRTAQVAVLLLVAATASHGLVRAYSVEPVSAQLSGWTDTLSQTLTINFDEPITASLFCGARGTGGDYHVRLYTSPGGVEIARGDTMSPRDHSWATCTLLVSHPDSFIKGRQVEVRWTRSGGDSIEYYYDNSDPYSGYGEMIVGQSIPFPNPNDLACRVFGRSNRIDSAWCGYDTRAYDTLTCHAHHVREKAESAGVGTARVMLNWSGIWNVKDGAFSFASRDSEVAYAATTLGCRVIGLLNGTAAWASSRWQRTRGSRLRAT